MVSSAVILGAAVLASAIHGAEAVAVRPITKVINVLTQMQTELQAEAQADEELMKKMVCWCDGGNREKADSIEQATMDVERLTARIAELKATSARLATEIEEHKKEKEAEEKALKEMTAIRKKEIEEFNAMEKTQIENIDALTQAIDVLSKHHPEGDEQGLMQIHESAYGMLPIYMRMQKDGVKLNKAVAVLQTSPGFQKSYNSQSGEIFGILKDMKDTFERDLKEMREDEVAKQKAYEEQKALKESTIATLTEQIETKTEQKAKADQDLADAEDEKKNTLEALDADTKYLMNLKEKCKQTEDEFTARVEARQVEIDAVNKALEIVTGPDAKDLFHRSIKHVDDTEPQTTSFVQLTSRFVLRERAAAVLNSASKKLGKPVLSVLATRVTLDAFTKVKAAIDQMIAELTQEQEDEEKHKNFCIDELFTNEQKNGTATRKREDLDIKIELLKKQIAEGEEIISIRQDEVKQLLADTKLAGERRVEESEEYQRVTQDQMDVQEILKKVLLVLAQAYPQEGTPDQETEAGQAAVGAGFLQQPTAGGQLNADAEGIDSNVVDQSQRRGQRAAAGPPPPGNFASRSKNKSAPGVYALIQQIIEDSIKEEEATLKEEKEARALYFEMVQANGKAIVEKRAEIAQTEERVAQLKKDLLDSEQDLKETLQQLEELAKMNADLHTACDFTLKNYDVTQKARMEEIRALKTAKAILSGSNMQSGTGNADLE